MIKSVEISNFRGFKHAALSNLPKFNLVIGESGSGKTALLEAFWIESGVSPEIYFRMRLFRGMSDQQFQLIASDKATYEAAFSDIFHDRDSDSPVLIQTMDSEQGSRSLSISYTYTSQVQIALGAQSDSLANASIRPLHFVWRAGDKDYDCPLRILNGQIIADNPPPVYPGVFLASSVVPNTRENADRLAILAVNEEKDRFVKSINKVFPEILDLNAQSIAGQSLIWAKVDGLERQVPLAVVSSGLNKLVSILLGIYFTRGGVLLVDEIDNSFYFLDYEKVWRTIVEFCDEYKVQVFAATHNREFLKCVAKVMESRKDELSMLRTKFTGGECRVSQIEGVSSIEALNQDIEIRL